MKNRKLNVLVIENANCVTGALVSLAQIVGVLKSKVNFILALQCTDKSIIDLFPPSTTIRKIKFLELRKNWTAILYIPVLIKNTLILLCSIKKNKIDVIHVNDIYNMTGVLLKILKPEINLIYHIRLLPNSYARIFYNIWIKLILSFSDNVICVSKSVYNATPKSSKKKMIYDSMSNPTIVLKNKSSVFTYIYIGNYISGKGQNLAIEAFFNRKNELSNTQLIFIGSDMGIAKNKAYKNSLRDRVKEYGLTNKIIFKNYESNLSLIYQKYNITLNFSESESFSMVCLESLLNGTPVIATKCGGPEEIIENNINGILVENHNIDQMGEAMVTTYKNLELTKFLSENAPNVKNKFSLTYFTNKIFDLYSK